MKKPFLLMAGANLYPSSRIGDWIGCFETAEEARAQVDFTEIHRYHSRGRSKGEIKSTRTAYIVKTPTHGEVECDWYEVVDLRYWADMEELEVD